MNVHNLFHGKSLNVRNACVCYTNVCFSIVLYIKKGVHTNKQTKNIWQTIRNQDSVVILFCCFLAYIRPVLSFDCLLSLFSLLEGYTGCIIECEYLFSFIYCVHATACYFQKRSEMSQAHLGCTVNNVRLGHLIYLIHFNTVAILMSVILVAVDIVAVLCIIETRANSDYNVYNTWTVIVIKFDNVTIATSQSRRKNCWQLVFSEINHFFIKCPSVDLKMSE